MRSSFLDPRRFYDAGCSGIATMVVFGIVGHAFKKLDHPLAPLVLAPVLLMLFWQPVSRLWTRRPAEAAG